MNGLSLTSYKFNSIIVVFDGSNKLNLNTTVWKTLNLPYCLHNSTPLVRTPNQTNPVHVFF